MQVVLKAFVRVDDGRASPPFLDTLEGRLLPLRSAELESGGWCLQPTISRVALWNASCTPQSRPLTTTSSEAIPIDDIVHSRISRGHSKHHKSRRIGLHDIIDASASLTTTTRLRQAQSFHHQPRSQHFPITHLRAFV